MRHRGVSSPRSHDPPGYDRPPLPSYHRDPQPESASHSAGPRHSRIREVFDGQPPHFPVSSPEDDRDGRGASESSSPPAPPPVRTSRPRPWLDFELGKGRQEGGGRRKRRRRGRGRRGRGGGRGWGRQRQRQRREVFGDSSSLLRGRSVEERAIADDNPHIVQALQYVGGFQQAQSLDRVLQRIAPRRSYQRRRGHVKTVVHWGQRKLLLSEIEFLTNFSSREGPTVVVYAGAAPGDHTNYLSDLFPSCCFVLVDPSPFETRPTERILVNPDSEKGFFTDALARLYRDRYPDCLFISDIRTASWRQMNESEIERHVLSDLMAQMRWVRILKSRMAMLKFRLPYGNPGIQAVLKEMQSVMNLSSDQDEEDETTEREEDPLPPAAGVDEEEEEEGRATIRYLDGDIYLPVWGPITTSETRLITDGRKVRKYDFKLYEDQMFHFNTVTRTQLHDHRLVNHPEAKVIGLDRCFDCASEVRIVEEYLRKFGDAGDEVTDEDVISMIRDIDHHSSRGRRSLRDGNVIPRSLRVTDTERTRAEMLTSVDVLRDVDRRSQRAGSGDEQPEEDSEEVVGKKRRREEEDVKDEDEPPAKRTKKE